MLREVILPKFAPFIQTMLKGGVGDVTHNPFFLFFISLITKIVFFLTQKLNFDPE